MIFKYDKKLKLTQNISTNRNILYYLYKKSSIYTNLIKLECTLMLEKLKNKRRYGRVKLTLHKIKQIITY